MDESKEYPICCRKCGQVLAVREGNRVTARMKHRSRAKELRITLRRRQNMYIDCDKCGVSNQITGA